VHLFANLRRLFDLDADPTVIDAALARDRSLRPLVRARRGIRVPGAIDPFEVTVRAVLGQQVSVAAATTLSGRLVERFGVAVPGIGALGLTHRFPDAATLAGADLTEIGLTRARARAVNGLAEAVAGGDLELDRSRDLEHTLAELQSLPGFGPWTAHYVAMRAYGERDAFPASDLGLRRALGDDPGARAESWRPWRAYGAILLWLGPLGEPGVRTREATGARAG
jgi:AraC family transcriptional regulator of adaptative response / DNA-3-methyladenine glycosylase II